MKTKKTSLTTPLILAFLFPLTLTLLLSFKPYSSLAQYPAQLFSRAEKTQFAETTLSKEVRDFVTTLDQLSDLVNVEVFGQSVSGQDLQLVVLANPGIKTPEEAAKSGKPVFYIQGNIHAGEVEGKEAIMTLMREIVFENKKYLLDNQILLFCPNFNPDGNDKLGDNTRRNQDGSPLLAGERASGEGFDLNREGLKLEALEAKALVKNVLNRWDPLLLVDLHTDNGSWHGYSVSYAPAFSSAGHPEPTRYTMEKMLPWVNEDAYARTGMLMWWHGYYRSRPGETGVFTAYSHQPRYLTNYLGLRNRMAILSETFAHQLFEKRYEATYDLVESILKYTNSNAPEIQEMIRKADLETVEQVKSEAGKLQKGVRYQLTEDFQWVSILARETVISEEGGRRQIKGTGKIYWEDSVKHFNGFKPTVLSTVPRFYYFGSEFAPIAAKLQEHGVVVEQLSQKVKVTGEEFTISETIRDERSRYPGHTPVSLEGTWSPAKKTFKTGDYRVDVAQPLAWVIFYLLEPQSDDGLVYWNFFDEYLNSPPSTSGKRTFPVFKTSNLP